MPANSAGDYEVDPVEDMKTFDRLEPELRSALANARFDIAAPTVFAYASLNGARRAIERIEEIERSHIRITRLKVWGPDYPEIK